MGIIIDFPAPRWAGSAMDAAPREGMGTVLILPVVRIDRQTDETSLAGLKGLTSVIAERTALEPGEPVGHERADPSLQP